MKTKAEDLKEMVHPQKIIFFSPTTFNKVQLSIKKKKKKKKEHLKILLPMGKRQENIKICEQHKFIMQIDK